MNYQAIIFDLDGTLLDSKKDIAVATNATLKKMCCPVLADETIYSFVGRGVRDLIRSALQDQADAQVERALQFFNEYYLRNCVVHSCTFPGVNSTLEELQSRGVKMGVFTNKPQNFTDRILSRLGLEKYFDVIIGAENGYPHKPDSQGTLAILNHLGAAPRQSLMVGDSIVDLQTAQNAGLDCALMLYGFSLREEILHLSGQAKFLLEEFSEILNLVS